MRGGQHHLRRGAVGLDSLLTLFLLLLSVVLGLSYGIRWGRPWGIPGAIGGGLIGLVSGVAFTLAARLLAAWISRPFERFARWWRPYPPPCEKGTCTRSEEHTLERVPEEACEARLDLACHGYRCQCETLHAQLGGVRWVRVLPDGSIEPYLVHRLFGRWRPDEAREIPPYRPESEVVFFGTTGAVILAVGIAALLLTRMFALSALYEVSAVGIVGGATPLLVTGLELFFRRRRLAETTAKVARYEQTRLPDGDEPEQDGNTPGWTIPLITTLVTGGIAFLAIWPETGFRDGMSWLLFATCTGLGLLLGTAAWLGGAWQQRRMARTGRHPLELLWFVGLKTVSCVPGAVAVCVWVARPAHQSLFDCVVVSMMTGGLFLAGFFSGGLSFSAEACSRRVCLHRICRGVAGVGVALMIVGFALSVITTP